MSEPTTDPDGPDHEYTGSVDPRESQRRLRGWGPDEHVTPLSPEQAERLQDHDEPIAAANFGAALTGDLGNAEIADEAVDAPETREPDTSRRHEGGERYRSYEHRSAERVPGERPGATG